MTNQTNWTKYNGSDEQIADLTNAKNGYVLRLPSGREYISKDLTNVNQGESYWIIPDDPLREMKVRQSQTGQPVWVRMEAYKLAKIDRSTYDIVSSKSEEQMYTEHTILTTNPDWNIPNAEYSFTEFKD